MAQAKDGDSVKVNYTGRLNNGEVFDTSVNREPMQFTIGEGQVIEDFEQAVIGMNPGDSKTIKIESDKAYGPYDDERVITATRDQFPANVQPEIGQHFQAGQADGKAMVVRVIDVTESGVTLDANHPLAGKDLTFDIQLVEIA